MEEVEEEEQEVDEEIATRIRQEVVLLATRPETDQVLVSKLSRPVWPKSNPTIPSSLFKNDFQTEVHAVL